MCRVFDTLVLNAQKDKASKKHLEKLLSDCQATGAAASATSEETTTKYC